jgi:hypothetical protein
LLTLLLILLVTFVSLLVFLWVGTYLFQGYIYTEPTQQLHWQAPATAAIMSVGYTIWCLTIAYWPGATTTNIPVNTIIRFTPWEDMYDQPAPRIHAIKKSAYKGDEGKDGEVVEYIAGKNDQGVTVYMTVSRKLWQPQQVIAFEIEKADKTKMRFDFVKDGVGGGEYVSKDGWVMPEDKYGAPTGIPKKFYFSRLVLNIVFNVVHFLVWYVAIWLLLQYQSMHALGLAMVMWVLTTLILLPMILAVAAEVAMSRQTQTAMVWVWIASA